MVFFHLNVFLLILHPLFSQSSKFSSRESPSDYKVPYSVVISFRVFDLVQSTEQVLYLPASTEMISILFLS